MFVRGITLSLAALFAFGVMAETAHADNDRKKQRRIIVEDDYYYPGPPVIRHIPGIRIFFGDYALSEEEFDELYGTPRRANRDEDDEPAPAKPKRKASEREKQKQQKNKAAEKPAKPADPKKASNKAAAATGLSCEKATSVVTGYGFSSVQPASCSGKVYAFNATRDGNSFAIKLDSASGELTEVKKLP